MLDVHPAHHAATTWRDFFIHIATIVLGLLIAVGIEQTVEFIHHRHQARETRDNIQQEASRNIAIVLYNQEQFAAEQQQLSTNLDLLNSNFQDAIVLSRINYAWSFGRLKDAAWNAAKIDGSIALIPSSDVYEASYSYETYDNFIPTILDYINDMDTAKGIVDHASHAGKLTATERQQLLTITASARGHEITIYHLFSVDLGALRKIHLQ
jgi:hypothetical protein